MPFPKIGDTESWDWLVKKRNYWPKEKLSLYVRHFLVMHRLRRKPEAAALLTIVADGILAISLRHLRDRAVVANPSDVAETVTNELLLSLFMPKSSGRRGLRKFFWTTVRRKTDTVALRPIFKSHGFIQIDTDQAQSQPDTHAPAAIESNIIAEQARSILRGDCS